MIFLYALLIIFFVFGVFTALILGIEEVYQFVQKRKLLKDATNKLPDVVDEKRLCSVHTWERVPAVNEEGLVVDIQVCNTCGFIPTRNSMLPVETLNKMNSKLKEMAWEDGIIRQFTANEQTQLKTLFASELESGMDYQKVIGAYMAGQTLQERFIIFRLGQLEGKSNE